MQSGPLRKSTRVALSIAAAMGIAARTQAQDPCEPGSFSAGACKVAMHRQGYCSGGAWVPFKYSQPYPNYYDAYQSHLAGGGLVVTPAPEDCRTLRSHGGYIARSGFGSTGHGHHAGS